MAATASAGSSGSSASVAAWRRSTSSTIASSSSSRDPKWWRSMRWLVPTASATSRSDRPPIPPLANASMSGVEQLLASPVVRRARHPAAPLLAARLEALRLEVEVALREAPHEHADGHADRPPLVDALADERAVGPCGTTSWEASVVPPGDRWRHVHETPGSTSVTSHTSFGRRGCLISKRLPTSMPGPSSGHDPLDRRRPLRPALHVDEDVPDDRRRRVDLDAAVRDHVPNGTSIGTPRQVPVRTRS